MGIARWALFATGFAMAACSPRADWSPSRAAALSDSVRTFMAATAADVTREGPAAWSARFDAGPVFYMASEGQLVFGSGGDAARGVQQLTRVISHIELTWGDSLRVDPLAPGLAAVAVPWRETRIDSGGHRTDDRGYFSGIAEHGADGWRFRNAHWSVLQPQAPVR